MKCKGALRISHPRIHLVLQLLPNSNSDGNHYLCYESYLLSRGQQVVANLNEKPSRALNVIILVIFRIHLKQLPVE